MYFTDKLVEINQIIIIIINGVFLLLLSACVTFLPEGVIVGF